MRTRRGSVQRRDSASGVVAPGLSPILICGTARGGTTLLVRLLDSHPLLAVFPTETQLYPHLATRTLSRWLVRAADLFDWHWILSLLAVRLLMPLAFDGRHALARRLRVWVHEFPHGNADTDGVIDEAVARVHGPEHYWRAFLEVFIRLTGVTLAGKRYWVEKTPMNERYVPATDLWLGCTTRHVHILRDPRDFVASSLLRAAQMHVQRRREELLIHLCFVWSRSVQSCRYNLRTRGDRYHVLRYEDLVRHPGEVMEGVCRFLEIPMDTRILTATVFGTPTSANSSYGYLDPKPGLVLPSQISRFPQVLTPQELEVVERLLYEQMAACGYSARPTETPHQRFRLDQLPRGLRQNPKAVVKVLKIVRTQRSFQQTRLRTMSASEKIAPAEEPWRIKWV
jgi:hypothetical protein